MLGNFSELEQIKRDLKEAQREMDQAEAMLQVLLKKLKEEFGCSDLIEGKNKLQDLVEKHESLLGKFNKSMKQFKEKWKEFCDAEACE